MRRTFLLWLMVIPNLNCRQRYLIWQWAFKTQQFECNLHFLVLSCWTMETKQKLRAWYYRQGWVSDLMILQEYPYLTLVDAEYPFLLSRLAQPPVVLFYRGNLEILKQKKIAVVGSRKIELATKQLLDQYVLHWVEKHLATVSGNAAGVDCLAHQLTLQNHGSTIAVLGTGIDQAYPLQNAKLQKQIEHQGLVLSEYLPWEGPKRWHFPERNRIIVGLVSDVVISQATTQSGTVVTAEIASDENRNVWILPLLMKEAAFSGNRELYRDGANLLLHPLDLF